MGHFVRTDELFELADRQHDMVSVQQLLALDATVGIVREWVDERRIFHQCRGVYRLTRRPTLRGRWMAATLTFDGHLIGRSAGALAGLYGAATKEILVAARNTRARDGIRPRRVHLEPWEQTTQDNIPTVIPARILLDLSAGASPQRVRKLIDRAEELEIYDERAVTRVLHAHPRLKGAKELGTQFALWTGPEPTYNELEDAMYSITEELGMERAQRRVWVEGYEADFWWPEFRLIVETDGKQHFRRMKAESDRDRDTYHATLGIETLRFTRRQVVHDRAIVKGKIGAVAELRRR